MNVMIKHERWLSSKTVGELVRQFAVSGPVGTLKWRMSSELSGQRLAEYDPVNAELLVSNARLDQRPVKQVETILHEIQHWNQHNNVVWIVRRQRSGASVDAGTRIFIKRHEDQTRDHGYEKNWFERDARKFASENLDKALEILDELTAVEPDDTVIARAVADVVDFYDDTGEMPTTNDVRIALHTRGVRTPGSLDTAMSALRDMGFLLT